MHALDRLGRKVGADEPTLVIGDGAIGLLLAMVLSHRGCRGVTLVGGRAGRLAIAADLGVARTLNYHELDAALAEGVMKRCGRQFPLIFEASGSPAAMDATLELVEKRGTIVEVGDYGDGRATFSWNHILHKEPVILGANASSGAWPESVRMAPQLPLGRLVSRRVPAARYEEGLALVKARGPSIVKVVLEW